jgi:hypothetical protein
LAVSAVLFHAHPRTTRRTPVLFLAHHTHTVTLDAPSQWQHQVG